MSLEKSAEIFTRNRNVIPGGVVSVNRAVVPEIAFLRGQGSRVWDADGTEYIDYHAGFAPYILGHNDRDVNAVVKQAMDAGQTLMGSGTNTWEGRCAELIVKHVNTGQSLFDRYNYKIAICIPAQWLASTR